MGFINVLKTFLKEILVRIGYERIPANDYVVVIRDGKPSACQHGREYNTQSNNEVVYSYLIKNIYHVI